MSSIIPQWLHTPPWSCLFSMQLQSIDWSTWQCIAGNTQFCLLERIPQQIQSSSTFLSLQVQSFIACLLSQHVLSSVFSLNCLIQFLHLIDIESADVHCVGCSQYNLHVYCLDEIGIIEFGVCYHFYPPWYLFLNSFKHCFCSDTMSLFNSKEWIDFVFIWVHGFHSSLQHPKTFSVHHLSMFKYHFHTLRYSIAGSSVVTGLYNDLVDMFNALWLSWCTFRLSTNRLLFFSWCNCLALPFCIHSYVGVVYIMVFRWYKMQLGSSYHLVGAHTISVSINLSSFLYHSRSPISFFISSSTLW